MYGIPVLNKTPLPYLFSQTSAPITRPDTTPLQVGDRWWTPATGVERWWDGDSWEVMNGLIVAEPLINGVQHFYRNTKPTVRPTGQALVFGDKWYNTADGTEWYWNGTWWLSPRRRLSINSTNRSVANTPWSGDYRLIGHPDITTYPGFFVHSVGCLYQQGTNDTNNYWTFLLGLATANGTPNPVWMDVSTQNGGTGANYILQPINTYYNNTGGSAKKFAFATGSRIGSPSNLTVDAICEYSLVHA